MASLEISSLVGFFIVFRTAAGLPLVESERITSLGGSSRELHEGIGAYIVPCWVQ